MKTGQPKLANQKWQCPKEIILTANPLRAGDVRQTFTP